MIFPINQMRFEYLFTKPREFGTFIARTHVNDIQDHDEEMEIPPYLIAAMLGLDQFPGSRRQYPDLPPTTRFLENRQYRICYNQFLECFKTSFIQYYPI
jgi:hypothetical protein